MLSRLLILCLLIFSSFGLYAQISIGGGFNSVAAIGIKNPYLGLNFSGEYRNDDMSYFAKFYTTLPQNDAAVYVTMTPINSTDSFNYDLPGFLTYRYNVLEFGKRFYYAKDLEFGPAAYLSSHFAIMMNTVGVKTDAYDKSRYTYPTGYVDKGKIYAAAVGLNVGGQYSFYYGSYFLDFGLNYLLTGLPNNDLASSSTAVRQLFFAFNFGFKKTIFTDF